MRRKTELESLKLAFARPACPSLKHHTTEDGEMADCCLASKAIVESVVHTCATNGDLFSLLQYLEQMFEWGTKRHSYCCEIVENSSNVDCAARTTIALELLGLYFKLINCQEKQKSDVTNIQLACVHVIVDCDELDTKRWRQEIREEVGVSSSSLAKEFTGSRYELLKELKERCRWIETSLCYHKCIGFISNTGHLSIWDFGEMYVCNPSTKHYVGAVQSICVTPHAPCVGQSNLHMRSVTWGEDFVIPLYDWSDVPRPCPFVTTDICYEPSEVTQSVVGDSISESMQRRIISQIFSSTLQQQSFREGSKRNVPWSIDATTPLSSTALTTVYISGCHMSTNPGPGVGVGRALRAFFPKTMLRLVAIDDMIMDSFQGLTDHIFDEVRSFRIGTKRKKANSWRDNDNGHCGSIVPNDSKEEDVVDDTCWQVLQEMLVPAEDPKRAFFIPCTDKDVQLLARKKSDILSEIGACTVDKAELKSRVACSRILCPNFDIVALCKKPQMLCCVSVMKCFDIPDYILVDNDVSLVDVQAFCEVEYPVLIKGCDSGAWVCQSWGEVASLLSHLQLPQHASLVSPPESRKFLGRTAAITDSLCNIDYLQDFQNCSSSHPSYSSYSGQTFFLQRLVNGTDKTILFCALKGVLTGCFLMTKVLCTAEGKVWAGDVKSVPKTILEQLEQFVQETNWTGGGEIEFVETIEEEVAHNSLDLKKCFLIDLNPRFPAWVLGSIYTGCNLLADFVSHVIELERFLEPSLGKTTRTDAKIEDDDNMAKTFPSNDNTGVSVSQIHECSNDKDICHERGQCECSMLSRNSSTLSDGYSGDASSISTSDDMWDQCSDAFGSATDGIEARRNIFSHDVSQDENFIVTADEGNQISCPDICDNDEKSIASQKEMLRDNGKKKYASVRCSFTRSVVELPRLNYVLDKQICIPFGKAFRKGHAAKQKSMLFHNYRDCTARSLCRVRKPEERGLVLFSPEIEDSMPVENSTARVDYISSNVKPVKSCAETSKCVSACEHDSKYIAVRSQQFESSRELCEIATTILNSRHSDFVEGHQEIYKHSSLNKEINLLYPVTPYYITSDNLLQQNLLSCQEFVACLINDVNLIFQDFLIEGQLCLSVKSQPHLPLLKRASAQKYFAECISLAEVASSIEGGYRPHEIILTGPGKFWLGGSREKVERVLSIIDSSMHQLSSNKPGVKSKLKLGGIYADSLADLALIMQRVQDPDDWLGANLVGIRFSPSMCVDSRFGLDANDPLVLQQAAKLIKNCDSDLSLGLHFHFAMTNSATGLRPWLGMLNGFIFLAKEFEKLCGKLISVMDFGGGWSPQLLHQQNVRSQMSQVVSLIPKLFPRVKGHSRRTMFLQFELGKAISESAGGLLCRVLDIREIRTPSNMIDMSHCIPCGEHDNPIATVRRAIVVDASIADLSCPHLHPVLWRSAKQTILASTCSPIDTKLSTNFDGWNAFTPGRDEIWGRTCMEFDILLGLGPQSRNFGSVSIPSAVKQGDFLLFTSAGSYDIAMQYKFGDGEAREMC